jgi:hypothetical protein
MKHVVTVPRIPLLSKTGGQLARQLWAEGPDTSSEVGPAGHPSFRWGSIKRHAHGTQRRSWQRPPVDVGKSSYRRFANRNQIISFSFFFF